MNSKEIFEKMESSITKALNKEDGIILGGKKLTFYRHENYVRKTFAENQITDWFINQKECALKVHSFGLRKNKINTYGYLKFNLKIAKKVLTSI